MNIDSELEDLYAEYLRFHAERIMAGNDPMAVAGVLMAQALSMYRTALNEDEYNQLVDEISRQRDNVKRLDSGITLQ